MEAKDVKEITEALQKGQQAVLDANEARIKAESRCGVLESEVKALAPAKAMLESFCTALGLTPTAEALESFKTSFKDLKAKADQLNAFEELGTVAEVREDLTFAGEARVLFGSDVTAAKRVIEKSESILRKYARLGTPEMIEEALDKGIATVRRIRDERNESKMADSIARLSKRYPSVKVERLESLLRAHGSVRAVLGILEELGAPKGAPKNEGREEGTPAASGASAIFRRSV